jgi:aminomethyltransferase
MYSPFELGLGRMVSFDAAEFVGKRALVQEQAKGGPPRRLVGLEIEWDGIERMHAAQGLPPTVPAAASRAPVPVYAGRRQIGRVTSSTWSPTLKTMIALASVGAKHAETGTELWVEWTVEGRRGKVVSTVVDLPFFDPPRKRA